jgi:hypothetical protein
MTLSGPNLSSSVDRLNRMPMALRAVEPHHRPVDVREGVGAFGHGDMLSWSLGPDLTGAVPLLKCKRRPLSAGVGTEIRWSVQVGNTSK